ncbi:Brp/Blh family beta-carotene 15,15'-dioxygenase [Mesohalobacter halotolerans]|uniref:Probable beta-carotene 15,15'-dioxygenase n=1 Tax=Mesohalobacter halotolerans TaxID=1883405 RepID=A0A4U5TPN7_9FLAO|nr:Brp/Blh family beta-carotene 15,15'-dioxygenase [Mesohalobacter halotolerans]MBS3739161.1 Brp/Blh family beta-carotene 15,15'-dioxygenase [Psychroflexus sp.]TKS55953.1 hypothetical protein FCN74_07935 [Mesohalobacter halotolerans]
MKIYHYSIVLSFVTLWLNSYIPSQGLYLLGLFLILSFGIIHGANDIVIIPNAHKSLKNKPLIKLIGIYLTVVLCFALFFTFFPSIAIILFILFSAYHFGEQHWHNIIQEGSKIPKFIFEFCYGCLIFGLIFMFHQTEVEKIITDITKVPITLDFLQYLLLGIGIILIALGFYFFKTTTHFKTQLAEQILYLLVLTIIFRVSDLIWAFSIYFVLWHSIPSLNDQIHFIYGEVNKSNILKYLKKAFWYWVISIIGLVVFYLLFKDTRIFEALLFSFLAAITFPHVFVINKMFKQSSS